MLATVPNDKPYTGEAFDLFAGGQLSLPNSDWEANPGRKASPPPQY